MTPLSEFFGPQSPLQIHLPGFQPRAGQAWMAEAVAETIAGSERLVVEAGTGTGKTFAYLIPALLSGRKTIISTGTKALQDQLYHRDLPLIGRVVGRPVTTALLKGRANYLCLHRLDQLEDVAASLRSELHVIREWRHRTDSGDRAELSGVPEDSAVWPLVTSTADNCLGQKCPQYADCHVVLARRAAQEADLNGVFPLVLTIAGAVAQFAEQLEQLRVHVVQPQLKGGHLAGLFDALIDLLARGR